MIPFVYDFLLLMMLFVLYQAGRGLKRNGGKIVSSSGFMAIVAYTFNEGLRFGRGVDYNLYWGLYERLSSGEDSDKEWVFNLLIKIMSFVGIPYQGFVMLESFLFILGVLFLLRNYREILPLALPLFAFFSLGEVENMIRWYIGFFFILIGLSFLLNDNRKYFFIVSYCGCVFHLGLLPVPVLFYLLYYIKKPFLHPILSIPLFVAIGLFFQTDVMINLVDIFNALTFLSERAAFYADDAETWLTGGYAGVTKTPFPSIKEMLFLFLLVWYGYKCIEKKDHKTIYVYNLFLFGFLLRPIANIIELVIRYDDLFYFFRSIVCAIVLYNFLAVRVRIVPIVKLVFVLLFLNILYGGFRRPFVFPDLCMYVWDQKNQDGDYMKQLWLDTAEKEAEKSKKR